jgi:predicted oxidoreductase
MLSIRGKKMKQFEQQRLILGCMRLNTLSQSEADNYLNHVIESGVTFFDHSDVYGAGECEKIFGTFLKNNPGVREKIIVQDKIGIISGKMYDASYSHIIEGVNKQLKSLNTDHLDILLIHRPDALIESEDVNKAFNELKKSGKVKDFGVSNFYSSQAQLLQKGLDEKLKYNQLQFGPARSEMVTDSLQTNMLQEGPINRYSETLDYCRLNDIRIQTWSPLQWGMIKGCFFNNPKYDKLTKTLEKIGKKYDVDKSAIAIAYNLRHPANMQVILGTMNQKHFDEMIDARNIKLEREEWYEIMLSAGYPLP